MQRRAFLQMAGVVIAGALLPAIIPVSAVSPRYNPVSISEIMARMGEQLMTGFTEGFIHDFDGTVTESRVVRYIPTALVPSETAEYDQEWEVVFVELEG